LLALLLWLALLPGCVTKALWSPADPVTKAILTEQRAQRAVVQLQVADAMASTAARRGSGEIEVEWRAREYRRRHRHR